MVEPKVTYEEVLGVDVSVLGKIVVLLGHEYTLLEEVLVDLLAIGLGNKPDMGVSRVTLCSSAGKEDVHCCEFLALFGESHTMLELVRVWCGCVRGTSIQCLPGVG